MYVWVHVLDRVSTAERSGKRPSLPSLLQWEGSYTIMEHFRCKKIFVNIEECFSSLKNFMWLFSVQLWSFSPLWLRNLYLTCREWTSPHSTVGVLPFDRGTTFYGSSPWWGSCTNSGSWGNCFESSTIIYTWIYVIYIYMIYIYMDIWMDIQLYPTVVFYVFRWSFVI